MAMREIVSHMDLFKTSNIRSKIEGRREPKKMQNHGLSPEALEILHSEESPVATICRYGGFGQEIGDR